ncbi:MAG: hypothetical protein QW512_06095 [Thermofilaceae archaeon]
MKCRRCGGVAFYRLFRSKSSHYSARVVRCPRCGVFLYFESDGVSIETPFRSYTEAVKEAMVMVIAFDDYATE